MGLDVDPGRITVYYYHPSPRSSSTDRHGVNWERMNEVLRYLPPRQAQRVERIIEVQISQETTLNEYCTIHLMELYPGQPDMYWDY